MPLTPQQRRKAYQDTQKEASKLPTTPAVFTAEYVIIPHMHGETVSLDAGDEAPDEVPDMDEASVVGIAQVLELPQYDCKLSFSDIPSSDEVKASGEAQVALSNKDALTIAEDRIKNHLEPDHPSVLVLNMADPITRGGGVRDGDAGQEENLYLRTNLSKAPDEMNFEEQILVRDRHRQLTHFIAKDVTVFRSGEQDSEEESYQFLSPDRQFTIDILYSPKPDLDEGDSPHKVALLAMHIYAQLQTAKNAGYRHLVLGPFGCDVGHDPELVAMIYQMYLSSPEFNSAFSQVDFAMTSNPAERQDAYNQFMFNLVFKRAPLQTLRDIQIYWAKRERMLADKGYRNNLNEIHPADPMLSAPIATVDTVSISAKQSIVSQNRTFHIEGRLITKEGMEALIREKAAEHEIKWEADHLVVAYPAEPTEQSRRLSDLREGSVRLARGRLATLLSESPVIPLGIDTKGEIWRQGRRDPRMDRLSQIGIAQLLFLIARDPEGLVLLPTRETITEGAHDLGDGRQPQAEYAFGAGIRAARRDVNLFPPELMKLLFEELDGLRAWVGEYTHGGPIDRLTLINELPEAYKKAFICGLKSRYECITGDVDAYRNSAEGDLLEKHLEKVKKFDSQRANYFNTFQRARPQQADTVSAAGSAALHHQWSRRQDDDGGDAGPSRNPVR